MFRPLCLALPLAFAPMAKADPADRAGFVEANLVWVFYHELAHALIDQLDLPVLGREEDAADLLAVVLIDEIWEPASAVQLAWYQALGWYASSAAGTGEEPVYWDVHGHDWQRFYTHVCLWYGADPDERADFAETFELPEARAETCAEEYDLARRSWFQHLAELTEAAPGEGLVFLPEAKDFADEVIEEEVRTLNALFAIPGETLVYVAECGEANAFYLPDESHIIICREYVDTLWQQAEELDL